MPNIQSPPPTFTEPVKVDENTGKATFDPMWLRWFVDMAGIVNSIGIVNGVLDHEGLGNLLGGTRLEHFHLTRAEWMMLAQLEADATTLHHHFSFEETVDSWTGGSSPEVIVNDYATKHDALVGVYGSTVTRVQYHRTVNGGGEFYVVGSHDGLYPLGPGDTLKVFFTGAAPQFTRIKR